MEKGVIVSDVIATEWRPTGDSLVLPVDTAHIWARLQDLTELTWPTGAEQTERLALVSWLNPRYDGVITDNDVLEFTSHLRELSMQSDPECLVQLYLDAEKAWFNLVALFNGKTLSPARPDYDDDTNDKWDEWSDAREAAGLDWWESVMNTLDRLFNSDVVYHFRTADLVQSDLRRELEYRTSSAILDTPSTVGANFYSGPLGNGFDVDPHEYKLHTLNALVLSTAAAADTLKRASFSRKKEYEAAAARHFILWSLLKGYLWAAASTHSLLSQLLTREPKAWEQAKLVLTEGLKGQHAANEQVGHNVGSNGPRFEDGVTIANTPIADIIAHMERAIESSKQLLTPLPL